MSEAQKVIGAYVRAVREQHGFSLESLAAKAGISYQYLSGIETGKENFSIQVFEALAKSLDRTVPAMVSAAYGGIRDMAPPRLIRGNFRSQVPLPEGLTIDHIEFAANLTQSILHGINRNLLAEIGHPLRALIQGNNFSGIISNIFCNSLDQCSPYKHNHEQRYPDLKFKEANQGQGEGLEVKTTVNIGKGGESHNGHSGWHVLACYSLLPEGGDIEFVHIMVARLNGHSHEQPDWTYLGSKVNESTGSRRTETYTTTLKGTTKLRDGSVYLNADKVSIKRWKQDRVGEAPNWSIFSVQR